jgi:outer membrane immunogenic protein
MRFSSATRFAATALAAGASGVGHAADLPTLKSPPAFAPPPPALTWEGAYAGVHAGYLWSTFDPDFGPFDPATAGSAIGGIQAGYNWQFEQFVLGFEGDISGLDATANKSAETTVPVGNEGSYVTSDYSWMEKVNAIATLRGRAGFAVGNVLLFGTGGVAFVDWRQQSSAAMTTYDYQGDVTGSTSSSSSAGSVRVGWTAGGGAEWKFDQHWSAGVQYLFLDFGSANFAFAGAGTIPVKLTAKLATVSLNYHW